MRLGSNRASRPQVRQWAERVGKQLSAVLAGLETFTLVALAGEQYRTVLVGSPWS